MEVLSFIPTNVVKYYSIDKVLEEDEAVEYPVEFLNSVELSGLPSHELLLKVGIPVMLLRNLDPPTLCNGTRLCIKNLWPNVIEATVLTGCARGEHVFIPRIPLISDDLAFTFQRLQFPVRPAFAMTINKAQGQSLMVAGVNLENQCFSHGQLYVACSRVGNPNNLFIYCKEGKTKNIVYEQALL
jgi:ATP-dependent DNA helicase PIF1